MIKELLNKYKNYTLTEKSIDRIEQDFADNFLSKLLIEVHHTKEGVWESV